MPPVMGAAALIIASFHGSSFPEVGKSAMIPAALFFVSVEMMVHFEAKSGE